MSYFIQIGTRSFGLALTAKYFEGNVDCKIIVSDHRERYTERARFINQALNKSHQYRIIDNETQSSTWVKFHEFVFLDEFEKLSEFFREDELIFLSLDFPKDEEIYLKILYKLIDLRINCDKPILLLSDYDQNLASELCYNFQNEIILNRVGEKMIITSDFIKHIFFDPPVLNNNDVIVNIEQNGITAFLETEITKLRNPELKEKILKECSKINFVNIDLFKSTAAVIKYLNAAAILIAFFSEINGDAFINWFLVKPIGLKVFKEIKTAVIALYNINHKDISGEIDNLYDRLIAYKVGALEILPWLIQKELPQNVLDDLKTLYRFYELKNIHFAQIQIVVIFFKKLGHLPPF